ncbi:hypothetical protein C5167_008713 [Papaver somniferum]|uniref:Uncharacterized protein n=1 Tax=Papaver somniferum TaxID=3469 RepID=A0A4Y7JZ18_PAPSO|nr:hypothetical protein C5167_008713 [Papaver somniferum]
MVEEIEKVVHCLSELRALTSYRSKHGSIGDHLAYSPILSRNNLNSNESSVEVNFRRALRARDIYRERDRDAMAEAREYEAIKEKQYYLWQ